ncbi:MAG: stage V sporulation protein M [Bacteroidetes bacterium]|nr:stage V sporulation protein M [Bacteroidota bacterium]
MGKPKGILAKLSPRFIGGMVRQEIPSFRKRSM